MTAMVCGVSSAAPMPWKARAAMRTSIDGDSPQASEPTVKITMPMR